MASKQFNVVISGISGKFPNCHNFQEFKEKLLSKEVLLTSDEMRWNPAEHQKPFMTGKIPEVDKFDATFFGVIPKLAQNSDPILASILESSTEAFIDAGINPYSLKGRNISVIVASSITDAEVLRYSGSAFLDGFAMQGLARTMFANRISYIFNLKGPSYNIDSSWVSAVQGLETAATAISQGLIEAAMVTTANLTFHNSVEEEYMNIGEGLLSKTGKCSPFDAEASGILRSEAAIAFFIQRAEDAKRTYCSVLNAQTRCLHGSPASFTGFNPHLETFLRDFYSEIQVDPKDVSYIETFGFCTKERDAHELNVVANVFGEKRQTPLLVGCGTGNFGMSEASSGFMSLAKVIIALEDGVIPPTINYHTPNPNVPALLNGQLKPVTESTKLTGEHVAVNCMNYSGNVAHILLKQNNKARRALSTEEPPDDLPRLCILQARHEEGANVISKKICSTPVNVEFISLVNDVFKVPISHYLWRAFSIVPAPDSKIIQEIKELGPVKPPVWFVFSGMGSQWTGMGRDLLKFPVFAAAIDKCDQYLRPVGVDIKHIITSDDPSLFDNILNCFVGITSVQIGLVDILRTLGVTPDGIIGHSTGEIGCAYADNCFTLEEAIMSSYARGKATLDVDGTEVNGMMAAVGIGFDKIKEIIPASIDVACHNAEDSCTVSGPAEDIMNFVDKLKQDGVFAKAVSVAGKAYHSRYIRPVAPKLLGYLKKLIKSPRTRSSKWISSSVPESEWGTDEARLCSAEYNTNNLLNPVYFQEACKYLPKNAVIIEIAPHGLLQAILRRSISSDCVNIPLTNRAADSNIYYLLNAIGRLYLNNVDVDINALYPPVDYPVARGTPSLANLVTWDHQEIRLQDFRSMVKKVIQKDSTERTVSLSAQGSDFELWQDHRIEGQVVVPTSQLLTYPWTMLSTKKRKEMGKNSVIIENVIISDQVSINENEQTMLVTFATGTLLFEVSYQSEDCDSCTNILTGKLYDSKIPTLTVPNITSDPIKIEKVTSKEIYGLLSQCGYQLGAQFQVIKQIVMGDKDCIAKIKWTGNFMVFLDALFKFLIFLKVDKHHALYLPTSFIKLAIDAPGLSQLLPNTVLDVHYDNRNNRLVSAAVELLGVTFKEIPYTNNDSLKWKEMKILPYFDSSLSLNDFIHISLQIALEADFGTWMKRHPHLQILLVRPNTEILSIHKLLENTLIRQPHIHSIVVEVDVNKAKELLRSPGYQKYLVVAEPNTLAALTNSSNDKLYGLTYLKNNESPPYRDLKPILFSNTEDGKFTLLKKIGNESSLVFYLDGEDWLEKLRGIMSEHNSTQPVVVVCHSLAPRHVLPILASEPFVNCLRTVFIQQTNAPRFSEKSLPYSSQLSLGLPVNILSGGVWGSLRTFNLNIDLDSNNFQFYFKSSDVDLDLTYVGFNTPAFNVNSNVTLPQLKCFDYSGTTTSRQSVMGVAQLHSDSSTLIVDSILRWPIPADWTLLDAATVPVIYGLAYYCIYLKAKVAVGDNVLLLAGLSMIGQAIISIALKSGANVIVVVTNQEEQKTLVKRYPNLNPSHILISGGKDIDIPVKKLTGGKGVEVIINCLRGKDMLSAVKLMVNDCRFLHLGHISIEDRESIDITASKLNFSPKQTETLEIGVGLVKLYDKS